MKLPQRFGILPAYVANLLRPTVKAPSPLQIFRFLSQPGKENRAKVFLESVSEDNESYLKVRFTENPEFPLFYPLSYRWIDFCQTVDECFNTSNWHHFLSPRFKLTASDTVVDCGAAEGLFTWYAANLGASVHAFEPDSGFASSMRKSFDHIPNVEVHRCALGHRPGQARLSQNEIFSRLSADGSGVLVDVRTLDQALDQQPVSFIKADVEGHEFRVLLGAESIIRRNQPRIAVTMYHPQNNVAEIADFLRECHPAYQIVTKGIYDNGHPVLLQAWV
jgi:FkbM family methyltransferase